MTLPIYTIEYLFALFPYDFRKLGQYERGDQRTPIGKPMPNHDTMTSWFVVRIGRRRGKQVMTTQGQEKGTLGMRYLRSYYTATHYDYVVCSVHWDEGQMVQHTTYPDRAGALADIAQRAPQPKRIGKRAQRLLDRQNEIARYYKPTPVNTGATTGTDPETAIIPDLTSRDSRPTDSSTGRHGERVR